MKNCVRQTLNIGQEALAEKYLGLPMVVGRSTTEAFEFMPSRIRKVIRNWSGREASQAGREILLKSVAQAVPTYSMSCFLLSETTCRKMKGPIANYWWGGSAGGNHLHWQRWERLTYPKEMGVWGFVISEISTYQCLGNKGGDYRRIRIVCVLGCSKEGTTMMGTS